MTGCWMETWPCRLAMLVTIVSFFSGAKVAGSTSSATGHLRGVGDHMHKERYLGHGLVPAWAPVAEKLKFDRC